MLTWFLVKCLVSYNHLQGKTLVLFTRVTSTLTLLSVMNSSMLVLVLGGICTCSFLCRSAQSLLSISQRFVVQDANRPAGCHHRSLKLWDDVSPLRSFFVFFLFKCSIIMSVAIYPYMPHSKRPNISETGLQSVSSTVDLERLLCKTWK